MTRGCAATERMPQAQPKEILARLTSIPGMQPQAIQPLTGGMIAAVYKVTLQDGGAVVVKAGVEGSRLDLEGDMLRHLASVSELPLPPLLYSAPDLLILGFVAGNSQLDDSAQEHAAELLAALHGITWTHYGHAQDTLIGPLHQPNPPTTSWIDFFREQRLLYFARVALEADSISASLYGRLETLAGKLERWLHRARATRAHPWRRLGDQPAGPERAHHRISRSRNLLRARGNRAGLHDPVRLARPHFWRLFLSPLSGAAADRGRLLRATSTSLQPVSPAGARKDIWRPLCCGGRAHAATIRSLDILHINVYADSLWQLQTIAIIMCPIVWSTSESADMTFYSDAKVKKPLT